MWSDKMKITFNWLKQYVDFVGTPQELAQSLTLLGLEVEGVQKLGGEFDGVVVAEVAARDKHPNADKLSLCRVNDGHGERQIVCGAQNFKAGDKVPLILPGHSLPAKPGEQPVTIKAGKIRGCESQGMLCSPDELGLPDKIDGLLILRPDSTVGQPFAEYLGRQGSDVVYDLEITPNRPDWNSVIGIAREISALTGNPLRVPEIEIASLRIAAETGKGVVSVRIDEPELCPRYTGRVIRGVEVGPSPAWLRSALEKVGLRSINNVVDVTNFVMLETGHPLHAFDLHLLEGGKIIVRRAAEGEKFVTLDGKERVLTDRMLLIADETKGVALAGIMGGQNSEINSSTADVLLESACFKPQNIRATSRKLDLRTDSSYRFERGADVGICDWASRRAAQLILETAGGTLLEPGVDAYPTPAAPRELILRPEKTNELLGIEIPAQTQADFLTRLGFRSIAPGGMAFRVPTFRVDIKREVDLIEEIGRLYGVDKIPSTAPRGAVGANAFDAVHDQIAEGRRLLAGLGLLEAQGQTLISEGAAKLRDAATSPVALQNPLSSDMNVLRASLLPGLLESLRHNVNHKNDDAGLFEIGRVFVPVDGKFKEERRLGLALTGRRLPAFWSGADREAKFDIYDLKGMLEEFFEHFGLRGVSWTGRGQADAFFLESASVQLGKLGLGEMGQLAPGVQKSYDLRDPVFLAELNFDLLLARRNPVKSFKPLPAYPSIRRDVAMLLPEATLHEAVLNVVRQAKPQNLEKAELFDVFRGKNVPEGQKSMAYAFTYRNPDRTLTDAEVNAAHGALIEQLRQTLHATVREA
ncbi:MAG TPA: phenylalanine--tRNA ligase subunit beta [Candidatus Baltobacteraceae bacterium]|jgi:phenylalanyl-tRNA synthetase beta chain|nr:phenylalanine--tRNA ligase subunit beta [Candidatus Baltobacteraceae bacterium]